MSIPIATFRRTDFQGMTDTYGYPRYLSSVASSPVQEDTGASEIQRALNGIAPLDVSGQLAAATEDAASRLNRYRLLKRFYTQENENRIREDGDLSVIFNYCKKTITTGTDWLVGAGWEVRCPKGYETVAAYLNRVWAANKHLVLLELLGQSGGLYGDAFLMVSVSTQDKSNPPKIVIAPIQPNYCFPVWESVAGQSKLTSVMIQYPQNGKKPDGSPYSLYTLYITPETYEVWLDRDSQGEQPNQFGEVNVIHIPNQVSIDTPFGSSDLQELGSVNTILNSITNKTVQIIDYHAEPTTCIFGAKVSSLEKGAGRLWSNLPVDGKVENLALNTDLAAIYNLRESLKKEISELGEIPRVALDPSDYHFTNTSGIAMQLMFLPLITKTTRKHRVYGAALQQANTLILKAAKLLEVFPVLPESEQDFDGTTELVFKSLLPRDVQAETDLAVKKVEMGVWSRAEAIRQLSGVSDMGRLTLELAADASRELLMAYENQKSTQGVAPNIGATFIGSEQLLNSHTELAADINKQVEAALSQKSAKKNLPETE